MPAAPASAGAIRRPTLTPPACSAVISLSAASRVNTCSTATSTAIGRVTATMNGTDRRNTSTITLVARGPGDARAELHLLLEIAEGPRAAELPRLFPAARRARGYEGEASGGAPPAALWDGHGGSDVL